MALKNTLTRGGSYGRNSPMLSKGPTAGRLLLVLCSRWHNGILEKRAEKRASGMGAATFPCRISMWGRYGSFVQAEAALTIQSLRRGVV